MTGLFARPEPSGPHGHAFISYVREDSDEADKLQRTLEAAGISVWRDTASLWPGADWRLNIRRAITDDALVFIACFSRASLSRGRSYQDEELTLAIGHLRQRQPEDPWLIPVRFDDCEIPDLEIGGGRTLSSIQRADLFGDRRDEAADRLVASVLRILGPPGPGPDLTRGARKRRKVWAAIAAGSVAAAVLVPALIALTSTPSAAAVHVYSAGRYDFNGPDAIAVDGSHLWVANYGGSVTELNAGDGSLVRTLSAARYGFDGPKAIAVDGSHLWVANYGSDSVTELNAGDGSLVQTLAAASYGFTNPDAIAVDGTQLWVASEGGPGSVTEVNADNGRLVQVLSAANYGFDSSMGIAADGTHLWVADYSHNSVTELNAGDGSLVQTLHAASYGFHGPLAIAVGGTQLWVASEGGWVTELNAADGRLVRILSAASYAFDGPEGIAVDGTHVWVATSYTNSVTELNAGDGRLARTLAAGRYGFRGPAAIAVDGTDLWVVNSDGNSVTELPTG